MLRCPTCTSQVPDGARFCSSCGGSLTPAEEPVTQTSVPSGEAGRRRTSPTPAGPFPDSFDEVRFLPGTILAGRYRIVGQIGKGGMGEVYRADDLKLGQTVALKFLPEGLERNAERLARFFNEVRTARQVTHPNVCRVYDTGEIEGQHFLSMEYVDGEDLASLLRRIGRLPSEKAVQIARQLCAGLAAAHAQGFLHRDLKPANVMLDGRGQVKITDFGLAGLAEGFAGAEIRAGTPTYMAPEQLAGKHVSLRSDLYSLGLVLYELFTGKAAFQPRSMAELRSMHETTPTNPSSVIGDLDPAVERVILRCLESDPSLRPASALAVAAALPGGDPLSAALAAGETPSPDMVAAAGGEGGVKPPIAVVCLVVTLLGLVGFAAFQHRVGLLRHVPLDRPPEALTFQAREILVQVGHDAARVDSARGMHVRGDYFDWARQQEGFPGHWHDVGHVRPAPLEFWYRESPEKLRPYNLFDTRVTATHPERDTPGGAAVWLDTSGRLTRLEIVPPTHDTEEGPWPEPDWAALFARSGLDLAALRPARPEWNPLLACETRAAWDGGGYADQPDVPIRVEAGAYHGKPIYFEVVPPWKRAEPIERGVGQKISTAILVVMLFGVLLGGVLLARRNLRLGRGDRRGAFRIASFIFIVFVLRWVVGGDHVADVSEVGLLLDRLAWGLLWAASVWTVYVALEPHARRLWPNLLIAWTRLLAGRYRDPLVGRSILAGGVCMTGLVLISWISVLGSGWLGLPPEPPFSLPGHFEVMEGVRQAVGIFLNHQFPVVIFPIGILFVLVACRVLFRRPWPAVIGLVVVFAIPGALGSEGGFLYNAFFNVVIWSLVAFVLIRFGLLALVAWIAFNFVTNLPVVTDVSVWFVGRSVVGLLLLAALAVYGFWISLAGRPLVAGDLLEEPARI